MLSRLAILGEGLPGARELVVAELVERLVGDAAVDLQNDQVLLGESVLAAAWASAFAAASAFS